MSLENSIKAFQKANRLIPGGVNSPVRAFKSVDYPPIFIEKANGSHLTDIDGNHYIDTVFSWGPLILGHANAKVVTAIHKTAIKGTSFGAPTNLENEMAERIVNSVPSIEKVRMVNSGTEATMSAVRLARGYTGKAKIIKFAGNYHGHGDSFLIKAGSGALTFGTPDSSGITQLTAQDTLIASYNNLNSVEQLLEEFKNEVAAIIVEPVAGNMGVVPPSEGFLMGLRELSTNNGALLIFDEVITGFRLGVGGAQKIYGVKPDLTTLGKIIGGGLPVGAYGGKADIMDFLAPNGPVYQAGTLSGNPLAMAAGLAALKQLSHQSYYELEQKAKKLEMGIKENIKSTGIKAVINRVGSMMTLFFTNELEVNSYESAIVANTHKYSIYFKEMLSQGIYIAPSPYECLFVSLAHTDEDIVKITEANRAALQIISNS